MGFPKQEPPVLLGPAAQGREGGLFKPRTRYVISENTHIPSANMYPREADPRFPGKSWRGPEGSPQTGKMKWREGSRANAHGPIGPA